MEKIQMHFAVILNDSGQLKSRMVLPQAPITANSYGLALPSLVLVLSTR